MNDLFYIIFISAPAIIVLSIAETFFSTYFSHVLTIVALLYFLDFLAVVFSS